MNVTVIGTGYVGLTTGVGLASIGHKVICLDIDQGKIAQLKEGISPIFEPGLEELLKEQIHKGSITFTCSYPEALEKAEICMLALPSPCKETGECDLSYILAAAQSIGSFMQKPLLILNKSTVPPLSHKQILHTIQKAQPFPIALEWVTNPEFLKEGSALEDFFHPDRIILGVNEKSAAQKAIDLYAALSVPKEAFFVMDPTSAELTKYAANTMLALRISFMNELALLCDSLGANIEHIRRGIGSDARIGTQFLHAGVGFGGSCFPKDIEALSYTFSSHFLHPYLPQAILSINERQKKHLVEKIVRHFGENQKMEGKTISIWGLAFKPKTDDIRQAPSLCIVKALLDLGVQVRIYDPVAMEKGKSYFSSHPSLYWASSPYDAAHGSHAIALVTEWPEFKALDFSLIAKNMDKPIFFDGRNYCPRQELQKSGFCYYGIGT